GSGARRAGEGGLPRRDRVLTTSAARRPWPIAAQRPDLLRIPARPDAPPAMAALPSPARAPPARSAGWFTGVFTALGCRRVVRKCQHSACPPAHSLVGGLPSAAHSCHGTGHTADPSRPGAAVKRPDHTVPSAVVQRPNYAGTGVVT